MNDIVRVQIKDSNGDFFTIAQLDEVAAKEYIECISSDFFDARLMDNINRSESPLVKEELSEFKRSIDNAMFSEGFRLIPAWKEGEV